MFGRGRSGKGVVGEVVRGLLGGEVEVGEDHDPGRRVLEDLRPQPACSPAWNRSRSDEPERLEDPDHAREEPPRTAEGVVVVVRPAEPEPVLPRLLHLRRAVARLPVVALDLEDEVARQVGATRPAR